MQRARKSSGIFLGIVAVILAALVPATPARAASPADIQAAIERGKKYLYGIQKDGNWELLPAPDPKFTAGFGPENNQYGGLTAAATYALLASGEPFTDPRIQAAVNFLRKTESKGMYALGLRCQVWNSIPQEPWVKEVFKHDRDLLLSAIDDKGQAVGFFGYTTTTPKDDGDSSTSQFGVLGLWACNQANLEINHDVWQLFDKVWHQTQKPDGSWMYNLWDKQDANSVPTLSMSAAGVATLFITQDYANPTVKCGGNIRDPAIDKGIAYLGNHLEEIHPERFYYTMFGISRVGLASGYKNIGKTDWFKWGSEKILAAQKPDGSWDGGRDDWNSVPDTSFALLFLARGRAPVLFNKLEYDIVGKVTKAQPSTWNQRPRDVANLVRMIGKELETQLNWQVVNLHQGKRDLSDAPIIMMSGSTPPKLTPEDMATLRGYIEAGGLVVGNADCSNAAFAEGFRKLGEEMFPGRRFAELPADHPIYTAENFNRSTWKQKPVLEGIDNGSRELMLLIPRGDPARTWQGQSFTALRGDYDSQMMIDIVLYAVDKEGLRTKGETIEVERDDKTPATRQVKVARIQYNGNWDPEPGGWRRLSNIMHNEDKIDLQIQPVTPGRGQLTNAFQLAVLTVAGPADLNDDARKEIAAYVEKGGTLEVDVCGGRSEFDTVAETELAKIFPDGKSMDVIPADNPVYTANGGAEVKYRRIAKSRLGTLHAPRVKGLMRGKRIAVFFSAEDLSTGLVGQPNGGVFGYDPASASKIMADIIKYAAHH